MKHDILERIESIYLTDRKHKLKTLSHYNLTLKQWGALDIIHREGAINPSELAQALKIDRPTMTVVLKNLMKAGWVTRVTDPYNKRFAIVDITESGINRIKDIDIEAMKNEELLDGLTQEELTTLKSLLLKIEETA